MVDAERLVGVLSRVTDRLRILDAYAAERDALVDDRVRLGDLKYTFQTAIEACLDAAHHVVAAEGLTLPASNRDAMLALGRAGVLGDALAASMAGAVGFRNLLVHGYADVDDREVVANLDRLDDLRAFVRAMAALAAPRD